ncbi:MAG: hypothetical protein E6G39_01860 [Actinobacteria bacterium]|nr:MAG: hypothetical protein E6G39_01860 [Actinomycetota bacterium]
MNDFDPSLDEIVSAYVDDAATPTERALVEGDPALVERAATFRRLRAEIATPPAPADDEFRRTLIARAMADSAVAGATVHSIRTRRYTTVGPIAAAAAIIALFFGLGTWLVASQDNDDSRDTTAAAAPARAAVDSKGQFSGASATTAAANSAGSAASSATVPTAQSARATPIYLGRFDDEASLRQALLAPPTEAMAAGAPPSIVAPTCPRTDLGGASTYTADLRGRPVTILVAGTRADVIDDASCARTTLDLTNR